MKRNKRFNIFGWLAASALLLTTACTDSADFNEAAKAGEEGVVTLNLSIQNQSVMTRAEGADGSSETLSHISDGSQVDVLIFAIYESNSEDGTYMINSNNFSSKKLKVTDGYTIEDVQETPGQMKINFEPNTLTRPGTAAAITLKIPVEDDKYYKIACWAQNSECKAYNTADLQAVRVSYENAQNNDESRDAFCACESFASNSNSISVILKRPFAQINVGTAGWDYEGVAILKPSAVSYTESTITLNGVAQYYDVLAGKALVTTTADTENKYPLTNVTFNYATLPAFINVKLKEGEDYTYKRYEGKEEFLIIDLDRKNGIGKYVDWNEYKAWSIADQYGKTADNYEGNDKYTGMNPYDTETFKYLSMCYVLVPEAYDISSDVNGDNVTYGSTLSKIEFKTRGYEEDVNGVLDKNKYITYTAFDASNVPVQKNWRTNIVSFEMFTDRTGFKLWVVPEYCGDHNNFDSGEESKWHYDQKNGQFDTDNNNYGWDYYSTKSTTQNQ